MEPFRTDCSEFPNDNPALHDGVVWVCLSLTGRPRAVARPAPTAVEALPAAVGGGGVVTPTAVEAPAVAVESPVEAHAVAMEAAVESQPDPWAELVAQLVKVALEVGATRAAAVLPELIEGSAIDPDRLLASGRAALLEHRIVEEREGSYVLSPEQRATAETWRRVLRAESNDLSSCESTLDAWCAELVALISGTPGRAEELRRAVRRGGIAAFGLLQAA